MTKCKSCRLRHEHLVAVARGDHSWNTYAQAAFGVFNITAAEYVLEFFPREPIRISLQRIDAAYRFDPWTISKRHLKHVDNDKPGIWARLKFGKKYGLYLIEGYHRAENHRIERTEWTGYVLTPRESYMLLSP